MELCVLDYGSISNKWTVLHVQVNLDYLRPKNFMNGQLHATITYKSTVNKLENNLLDYVHTYSSIYIRWFKYDWDCLHLFTHKSVPVIFEPPCIWSSRSRHLAAFIPGVGDWMGLGAILDVAVIMEIRMLFPGVESRSLLRFPLLRNDVRVKGNRSFV